MQPLHRTDADELTTLAMENELLRHEVTHLRGRLAAVEADLARRGDAPTDAAAVEAPQSDEARDDLAWLLRRIEATPAALVLRRREGYRRLVRVYLGEANG